MYCPLHSGQKGTVVCDKDCAWYTGSVDGTEPECAVYTLAVALGGCRTILSDLEKDADEISSAVNSLVGQS